ncbi:MAG TPA: terminase TerL endonuclease subunit [Xanthobacteraceae bacterium]|jgi:phage terminase large subunit-like protein|nr:terminase TerL endonuclease subunit [Xanthobacteraceae bacterium]
MLTRSWDTAVVDWEERLLAGRSLVPELPLFPAEAAKALRVFKRLRLPDVIGTPTMGEVCGPWFFPIVAALFGSYDPATNTRHISEVFQLIPKGNSKSSNGGAVMVTALICNRRPEAEYLFIAPTIEVATIAYRQAKGTIKLDPELTKLFQVQDNLKKITHRVSGATLQIKAADTDVITGSKAVGTMIDETHVFAKKANAADIFIELRGALTKRPDGFLFQTTTQSKQSPSGVFASELAMARAVRDGHAPMPLLPVLYELPDRLARDNGWKERRYWPLVNPNLGRSTNEDFLAREVMRAEADGPGAVALIASQHFNVQIGLSLRENGWPGAEYWEAAEDAALTLDEILIRSEVIVVGIDGGGLDDLFGLAVVGRCRETLDWLVWTHAWCHRSVLDRRKLIASRLEQAQAAGELTIVEHAAQDIEEIVELIADIRDKKLLACVAVDPAGLGEFIEALRAIKITQEGEQVVGAPQGYQLMNAIKTAERKVENGTLKHAPNALMDWCVGNVKIEPTATAIRATKQSAGDAKIDPWMALMDAVTVMVRDPKPQNTPEYKLFFA